MHRYLDTLEKGLDASTAARRTGGLNNTKYTAARKRYSKRATSETAVPISATFAAGTFDWTGAPASGNDTELLPEPYLLFQKKT